MRRGAPPALRVDVGLVPTFARVARTSRGLGLQPATPPSEHLAPGAELRLVTGSPIPLREIAVVAGGQLAVGTAPGVAHTFRVPAMESVHDRRPPGLTRLAGAALSNAALLRADDGWRVVVLPSLGDIAAELGDGPVALRGDARRLAVAAGDTITEVALPEGEEVAEHAGAADALCFAGDVLLVACGSRVGPPGAPAEDGSPITALAGAASATRAVARHADGTISLWDGAGERLAAWSSPLPDAPGVAMSADGQEVALGGSDDEASSTALLRASDGALVRWVEGARSMSPSPAGDGVALAGDWGSVWLRTVEEEE